jgi:kynurenine formamidase
MPNLVDLSHPFENGLPAFPGDPKIKVKIHSTVARSGCNLTEVTFGSHQGTHLDVPYHFFDEGKTLDQMPLDRFFGPATLLDFAPGDRLAPGSVLSREMFEEHEEVFAPGAKVLYRTGWYEKFGMKEYFEGFPDLTLDAARWIASRRIALLGMDTPTPSADFVPCHHILLGEDAEIVLVEGLTNLHRIPKSFLFIGFPLNIKGRDGSPIRAVALVED